MRPRFATVGPLAAASATNIRTASAVGGAGALTLNGSTVSGGIAVLDKARRVIITSAGNDTGITFTLTGKGQSGQAFTEVLTGANGGAAQSVMDYLSLSSVVASGASAGNVSIGTNGVASSPWVQFDSNINGGVALQCTVAGTVNYTVQQTLDDPNNGTSPVSPQSMTWLSSADASVVGATTSQQSNYQFAPVWARILLNSGSGSVAGTFLQNGNNR